jgi:uncharacterized damage-inducible protein DinB
MNPEYFALLFDYNAWANHLLLDACAPLTNAEFARDLRSSFSSLRDTLAHIAGGEWLYFERFFRGRSPGKLPSGSDYPDLASLRARWTQIESDLLAGIAGLTAADLERVIEYRNTRGTPYENSIAELLQHVLNHSTYHRGQVTTLLRQLGAKPATNDLIYFFRANPGDHPNAFVDIETLRTLYEYDAWANQRMLGACAALTPEQFSRDLRSSFPSLRDTVTHLLGAQWVWLERFLGRMPTSFPAVEKLQTLESLRAFSAEQNQGLQDFVEGLTEDVARRNHEYRTFAGATFANPLWISLRHLVNHGTYHRGQVATMLRQVGAEPLSTDLMYFFRDRAGLPLN